MKKLTLISLLCLLTTACSTFTQISNEQYTNASAQHLSWPQRYQQISRINSWQANGSVAIRNSQKGWNASFAWQQHGSLYNVELFGPLGTNRVVLTGDRNSAVLITPNGKRYSAPNAEILLQRELGYSLPVSDLAYWIRSLPAPGSRAGQFHDLDKRMATLNQNGWRILYLRYTTFDGIDVPSRILLIKSPWVVHVIIHQWK